MAFPSPHALSCGDEDDSKYIFVALKGARVHRSAVIEPKQATVIEFKSTVEARCILQASDGGRIIIGAGAVIMPDCVLRCGAEGITIGRGAYVGEGVLCEARNIGDGAIVERGCILVRGGMCGIFGGDWA